MGKNRKHKNTAAETPVDGEIIPPGSDATHEELEQAHADMIAEGGPHFEPHEPEGEDITNVAGLHELANTLVAEAEAGNPGGLIDHETQSGSWSEPSAEEIEKALTPVLLAEAEEPVHEEPASGDPQDFMADLVSHDETAVSAMIVETATVLDQRADFEAAKNADNENIQKTLKKARAALVSAAAARVMLSAHVDPAFMNRSIHEGARYNVYAIGKFADIAQALSASDGKLRNAINIAVIKSLFNFDAQGLVFDGNMARAAASDKIKVNDPKQKMALVRHNVSQSTAPTQASSTMSALTTLGVVTAEGSTRNPTYKVVASPLSTRLKELLAA
jgi:hypothetical protein